MLAGAGAGGRTAAQLSRALFGDDDHLVTVRAEVSRLRRVVGALVATNPYRIADGATLTVSGQDTAPMLTGDPEAPVIGR